MSPSLQEKLGQEELRGGVQRGSASEELLRGTEVAPLTRENPFCPVDDLNTFAGDAVMSSLVSTFTKWRRLKNLVVLINHHISGTNKVKNLVVLINHHISGTNKVKNLVVLINHHISGTNKTCDHSTSPALSPGHLSLDGRHVTPETADCDWLDFGKLLLHLAKIIWPGLKQISRATRVSVMYGLVTLRQAYPDTLHVAPSRMLTLPH
ncbi:unnamed protein product [Gadus morhua 'NCC']